MQEEIERILLTDSSVPSKAEQLCEHLVNHNRHQFFNLMIHKAKTFSQEIMQVNENHAQKEHSLLKRIIFIINRQIYKITKIMNNQDQNMIFEVWNIINAILMIQNLNHKTLKQIIPSIIAFMSFCSKKEVEFIFENKNLKNKNPQSEIILAQALMESNISKRTICSIGKQIFFQFHKRLYTDMTQVLKILEDITDEDKAVYMVCTEVKRWTKYQNFFLNLLQLMSQSAQLSENMEEIVNSKTYRKSILIFLKVDQVLKLKKMASYENPQFEEFTIVLQSKYEKINYRINTLKASTIEIINFVVSKISKSYQTSDIQKWNNFFKIFSVQFTEQVVYDICLLGRRNPQSTEDEVLTRNSLHIMQSMFGLLKNLTKIDFLKQRLFEAIRNTIDDKEFLFFGLICNIKRFEDKYYLNQENFISNSLKPYLTNQHYFVSEFMCRIVPFLDLSQGFLLNFCSDLSKRFMLDQSIDLSIISKKYELTQLIEAQIQNQQLALYLYIIEKITKHQLMLYGSKKSQNNIFFEMISTALQDFERFPLILKTQIISICINVTFVWSEPNFINTIRKLICQVEKNLNHDEKNNEIFLYFCLTGIIKLSLQRGQRQTKLSNNYLNLINELFQCLIKKFENSDMDTNKSVCFTLSRLIMDSAWNDNNEAFTSNFKILDICFKKLCSLKKELSSDNDKGNFLKLKPNTEFFILVRNCILILQLQFKSSDEDMQIKISQMREFIIEMLRILSNFVQEFEQNERNEICSIIEVVTGIHLQEVVSQDLCLIIKSDQRLVSVIMDFLIKLTNFSRYNLKCVQNLIISLEGKISTNFLTEVVTKIYGFLSETSVQNINTELLFQVLSLTNLILLYKNNQLISSQIWFSISKKLLNLSEMRFIQKNTSSIRQSHRFNKYPFQFKKIQIKFLQFKIFSFQAKQSLIQQSNNDLNPIKNMKFETLVYQFKRLKKKMTLEDLTFIVFALQCEREIIEESQIQLILSLGYHLLVLKDRKLQISSFLKSKFNPIERIKVVILSLIQDANNSPCKHLSPIKDLLNQLEEFELRTPTPRKIIKQKNINSTKKSYQNQDEDVII